MKDKLTKLDRIKINIRKQLQQTIRKQIDNIQPGDMDREEYDMFRQEMSEILDFLANKDKYIELMNLHRNGRNNNVRKYFDMNR